MGWMLHTGCICAGVVLPLLNQTILLWQVLLGSVFLGQRYSPVQLFGILLVVAGVAKAAWPSGAGGSILGQVTPLLFDSCGTSCFVAEVCGRTSLKSYSKMTVTG